MIKKRTDLRGKEKETKIRETGTRRLDRDRQRADRAQLQGR